MNFTYSEVEIRTVYWKAIGYPPIDKWWRKWNRMTPLQKQDTWDYLIALRK